MGKEDLRHLSDDKLDRLIALGDEARQIRKRRRELAGIKRTLRRIGEELSERPTSPLRYNISRKRAFEKAYFKNCKKSLVAKTAIR